EGIRHHAGGVTIAGLDPDLAAVDGTRVDVTAGTDSAELVATALDLDVAAVHDEGGLAGRDDPGRAEVRARFDPGSVLDGDRAVRGARDAGGEVRGVRGAGRVVAARNIAVDHHLDARGTAAAVDIARSVVRAGGFAAAGRTVHAAADVDADLARGDVPRIGHQCRLAAAGEDAGPGGRHRGFVLEDQPPFRGEIDADGIGIRLHGGRAVVADHHGEVVDDVMDDRFGDVAVADDDAVHVGRLAAIGRERGTGKREGRGRDRKCVAYRHGGGRNLETTARAARPHTAYLHRWLPCVGGGAHGRRSAPHRAERA